MEALKPSFCSGAVQLLELLFKLNWHLKERAVAITDSFMSEEKRHQAGVTEFFWICVLLSFKCLLKFPEILALCASHFSC